MTGNTRQIRVLVIGASGNFGSRLVRQLALEPGVIPLLCGRCRAPLEKLSREIGGAEVLLADRQRLTGRWLQSHTVDVVVDASGPFQLMMPNVIEACIEARVHYLDLADGREFVTGITRFDDAARRAGIAVIAGASSTPALSHAVVDHLSDGWVQIDTIDVLISPSNRQCVGLAVARAMLAGAGKPVRVFDTGRWVTRAGWRDTRSVNLPGAGRRLASLVETPDLDLLVEHYRPRHSARFEAALGLPIEHRVVSLLACLVEHSWLDTALPFARMGRYAVNLLRMLGTDAGVMRVQMTGRDSQSRPVDCEWLLHAKGRNGPEVPTLAALGLVRKLRDNVLEFRGASACTGFLCLADFDADLRRIGVSTVIDSCSEFRRVSTTVSSNGVMQLS